jgi:hypothetical protein
MLIVFFSNRLIFFYLKNIFKRVQYVFCFCVLSNTTNPKEDEKAKKIKKSVQFVERVCKKSI